MHPSTALIIAFLTLASSAPTLLPRKEQHLVHHILHPRPNIFLSFITMPDLPADAPDVIEEVLKEVTPLIEAETPLVVETKVHV